MQFDSLEVFFNLFLRFQTLHIKCHKQHYFLWLLLPSKTHDTETRGNIDWVLTQRVPGSHLVSSDDLKYSRQSSPSMMRWMSTWVEGRAHTPTVKQEAMGQPSVYPDYPLYEHRHTRFLEWLLQTHSQDLESSRGRLSTTTRQC